MQYDVTHAAGGRASEVAEQQAKLAARIAAYRRDPLPHFHVAPPRQDDADFMALARDWRDRFARIVILGAGGASLGGQLLAQIGGWGTPAAPAAPQLYFADNLDAASFAALLAPDRLAEQGFLIASKSGGTPETLMQAAIVGDALQRARLSPAAHMLAIAGRGDNALRQFAATHKVQTLDHDDAIGGRFSLFTNVGLFPAALLGIDIAALRQGAQSVIDALFAAPDTAPAAIGAALQMAHIEAGRNISVLFCYADRLERLGRWYRQLWAESLGKNGKGQVPVMAIGPRDQHSQMQLYTEGPDDKFYTFITAPAPPEQPVAPKAMPRGLEYLAARGMGDLVAASARASIDTLVACGRPVRVFSLPALDAASVGGLAMSFILETILTADLMGVNAFDQPGVEQGKIRTRDYMGG